jgi:superfamily I DNA/RNA helicase
MSKKWSTQQEAIFDWFEQGSGNLIVQARAGTGKTTTILEGVKRAPEERILIAAFNRRIADELKDKIGSSQKIVVKTLHALGYFFIRKKWRLYGGVEVDAGRSMGLLFSLAKQNGWGFLGKLPARWLAAWAGMVKEITPLDLCDESISEIGYDFGFAGDLAKAGFGMTRSIGIIRTLLEESQEYTGKIDYSDMLYLPLVLDMVRPTFDLVVVDEAQDMNHAQLTLARRACQTDARVCIVGDSRQAIYGFRGADSQALDRMKKELDAKELMLTGTFRCPKAVVIEANRLVPDLEATSKREGSVQTCTPDQLIARAQRGDFVLSRTNAFLAGVCLSFLRQNIPARIVGKDIGEQLISIVEKVDIGNGMPGFLDCLQDYETEQVARLVNADKEEKIPPFVDIINTIRVLAMQAKSPVDLCSTIRILFTETPEEDKVVLSTVHKAKGLESDWVFLLKESFYLWGDKGGEEANIEYVAITRAKKGLVWVGDKYGCETRR